MSDSERGPQPPTPELDRRNSVIDGAHVISEFVDWLAADGIVLCRLRDSGLRTGVGEVVQQFEPDYEPYERMLERYFGLDGERIEAEKRALLDWLSKAPSA